MDLGIYILGVAPAVRKATAISTPAEPESRDGSQIAVRAV
jgi:hypothetical protein